MKNNKTFLIAAAVCALCLSVPFEASAQLAEMFKTQFKNRKTDKPSRISAMSMDVDVQQNMATLLGSVEVDDPEVNIKCRKMVIYLTDVKEEGKKFKEAKESKRLDRIECYGDVVITRAAVPGESLDKLQQAFANKAVYNVSKNLITLQENPVVVYGVNKLVGDEIQINTLTERVRVIKGVFTGKGSFASGLND